MKKLWDIWWNQWTWPLKLGTVVAILVLLLIVFLSFRSCGKKEAKIDHEAIQKVNSANKAEARQQVREMVEENLEVVEAVGNRTVLAEANAVERDRLIEEKVHDADAKVNAIKDQGGNVTQEQLQCILVPSDCS